MMDGRVPAKMDKVLLEEEERQAMEYLAELTGMTVEELDTDLSELDPHGNDEELA
jgi:hypothetical protein